MKPSTFSQIYIQIVFAVKWRQNLIQTTWEDELYKYITGIIIAKGQKLIAINGVSDHIHILIGMKPTCHLSDLVREVKKASTKFITESGFVNGKFQWQTGFGAFSYSQSALDNVYKYVMNQKEHHRKKTFRDEYLEFLNVYEVSFDEKYLFDFKEKM